MTSTINRRTVITGMATAIAATPAIAKQSHGNDRKLAKAYVQWLEAEQVYYDTPGDISDKLVDQITEREHPLQ